MASSPTSTELDADSLEWLTAVVTRATRVEPELMPRRHQRALRQLATVTKRWADDTATGVDGDSAGRWRTIGHLAGPSDSGGPDRYEVADVWLRMVDPVLEAHRTQQRRARYTLSTTSHLDCCPVPSISTRSKPSSPDCVR